jgi:hypothetical protein
LARGLLTVDRFAVEATELRRVFDARFEDPRRATSDRFVWDYWHVPGQYTALRTPAWTYFPAPLYRSFHERLVEWGRENLGCHDVSPPWLSNYVEGCRQELHGDLPHGPWAFVFSLTHWKKRRFHGGETLLVRDEVLDYWHGFESMKSIEEGELIRSVAPEFSRLVVFDPRIPHGVREVRGTHDPREGRLVIHGWFVQPRPFIEGKLSAKQLQSRIDSLMDHLGGWIGALPIAGMLSLRFTIDREGRARHANLLSDNTRVPAVDEPQRAKLVRKLRTAIETWTFSASAAFSRVTLPLVFER